jgi:serine/threonine protein kinase
MGEVYLAQDSKLGRKIAIKLLRVALSGDAKGLQRFQQEARAASALNHPNILTVHEIGQIDDTNYIVMEFIDGETLRNRMRRESLLLTSALEVAIQTASALEAAHEAGIVHRDVKPENIMLRRDGYVKVLDFGIAKLIEKPQPQDLSAPPTWEGYEAGMGTVIGTVPYMSPEQARGAKDIDSRTDIFSLGVLLYEMIAGKSPFASPTVAETFAAILNVEPPPLITYRPDTPPALERIVAKALCKRREERYQTAGALRDDLLRLKRELESGQLRARDPVESPAVSSATAAKRAQRRRRSIAIALATGLVVLAAVGWVYYLWLPKPPSFQSEIRKLTTSGKVSHTAISPDGNYLVYAEEKAGRQRLLVRQVNGTDAREIVEPDDVTYNGLTFSPDGEFVYYARRKADEVMGYLYRVRTLDRSSEKVREDIDTPVTFSPDGRSYAFGRGIPDRGQTSLIIAGVDGADERTLATHKNTDYFCLRGIAWSPDGKTIACSSDSKMDGGVVTNVVAVRVSDGSERTVSSTAWREIRGFAWLSDSNGLMVTAADKGASSCQIFRLSYPSGEKQAITRDLNDYWQISLAAKSKTLVAIKGARLTNIWLASADGDAQRAQQITSGSEEYFDVSWTPDGRILASGVANDQVNLWLLTAEGRDRKQLTFGPYMSFRGQMSLDGRYIVYVSNQKGAYNVWRINADGSNKVQLTNGLGEYSPRITPDSKWVLYSSDVSGRRSLWKVSIEGGAPLQLTEKTTMQLDVSPDGASVAFCYMNEEGSKWQVAIMPLSGKQWTKTFDLPLSVIRWLPDGKALAYIRTNLGVSEIWVQPLDGRKPKQITNFGSERISSFDWSGNGKQIAVLRRADMKDVVLFRD